MENARHFSIHWSPIIIANNRFDVKNRFELCIYFYEPTNGAQFTLVSAAIPVLVSFFLNQQKSRLTLDSKPGLQNLFKNCALFLFPCISRSQVHPYPVRVLHFKICNFDKRADLHWDFVRVPRFPHQYSVPGRKLIIRCPVLKQYNLYILRIMRRWAAVLARLFGLTKQQSGSITDVVEADSNAAMHDTDTSSYYRRKHVAESA